MRFGLKSFLAFVFAAAVFLAVGRSAGYWIAAGTATALGALAWSVICRKQGLFTFLRLVVGAGALAVMWFLAVDWSWFVEKCPDCFSRHDIAEYRVFGYPVSIKIDEDRTTFDLVLSDLGVPCTHEHADRWHKHRLWGLVICGCPCINGIDGLSGDDPYPPEVISAKMRELARNDPQFAVNLHERVLEDHDYKFFWQSFNSGSEELEVDPNEPLDRLP